jgi:hypothetical protein
MRIKIVFRHVFNAEKSEVPWVDANLARNLFNNPRNNASDKLELAKDISRPFTKSATGRAKWNTYQKMNSIVIPRPVVFRDTTKKFFVGTEPIYWGAPIYS